MRILRCVALLASVLASACSNGSGAPAGGALPSSTAATGGLTITVALPGSGSTAAQRDPAYIPSGTAKMLVFAAPNGTALPPTSPYQATPCGTSSCTLTITVPAGVIHLRIWLLDASNNYLSAADELVSVYPGIANSAVLTFSGNPAAVVLTQLSGPSTFVPGIAATATFSVALRDGSGGTIAGPGFLWNAVSFSANAPSLSVNPAQISVASAAGAPPTTLTLSYDGSALAVPSVVLTAKTPASGSAGIPVTAPAIAVSGTAPVPVATNGLGLNVVAESGSTWFGFVPAAARTANGVAVSLQQPATVAAANAAGGSLSFQTAGGLGTFSRAAAPADAGRAPLDGAAGVPRPGDTLPGPDLAALRAQGRSLSERERGALAQRRSAALTLGTAQNFWIFQSGISCTGTCTNYASVPFVLQRTTAHGAIWVDANPGTTTSGLGSAQLDTIAANVETAFASGAQYFGSSSYAGGVPAGAYAAQACDASGNTLANQYVTFPVPDPGYMTVLITERRTSVRASAGTTRPTIGTRRPR